MNTETFIICHNGHTYFVSVGLAVHSHVKKVMTTHDLNVQVLEVRDGQHSDRPLVCQRLSSAPVEREGTFGSHQLGDSVLDAANLKPYKRLKPTDFV